MGFLDNRKSLKVNPKTHRKLIKMKYDGEFKTMDDLINDLLDKVKK